LRVPAGKAIDRLPGGFEQEIIGNLLVGPEQSPLSRVKSLGRLASNKLAGEGRRWLGGCRVRQRGTGDRKAGPTRL
jgi:hypothetical protein